MLKRENALQEFVTKQSLYCVWIRASETPGAPLVSVWIDSEMRAFEGSGEAAWTLAADTGEEAPRSRLAPLTADHIKYGV